MISVGSEVRVLPGPPQSCRSWRSRGWPRHGGVAQLGEHLLCKQGVVGSIPITSTSSWCDGLGFGSVRRREEVGFGTVSWITRVVGGSCAWCCSAWLRPGLRIGVWPCCWSFESVNQVLVRLWACPVASTDRMVGGSPCGGCWRPVTGQCVQRRVKCAE